VGQREDRRQPPVLGKMLALGLDNGKVMVVDSGTGEVQWEVEAHGTGSQTRVAMSHGRFVASVGVRDAHWKLWDVASGELHMVGATHDGTGACICELNEQDERALNEQCTVVAHTRGLTALALSPGGERLASGGWDPAVILWDALTGKAELSFHGEFFAGEAHPQPSTLNPQPSTLNPLPSTLNPTPSTLNPQPSTLNPQP